MTYTTYDNLNEVTATERFDGDGLLPGTASPAPDLLDGGFETPVLTSSYEFGPAGSDWTWGTWSGINAGYPYLPAAPEGAQAALLLADPATGWMSQSVGGWAAGSYTIALRAATDSGSNPEPLDVLVDSVVVGSFTLPAGGTGYALYATPAFSASAGSHTVEVRAGAGATTADLAVDDVRIAAVDADADGDGVPDRPSASLLRAESTTDYDEQGRPYATHTFGVDPSTGTVSSGSLTTSTWYDQRGNVIKTAAPGGLVTKTKYNGVGWATKAFTTDGGGDAAAGASGNWADAGSVTGDHVLEQVAYTYDAAGNVTLTQTKQRFHDAADAGELGDPSSGGGTAKARVYYAAAYYDAADRLTASVDVGTNPVGGTPTAYTRPGSVPARSDAALVTGYAYDAAGRVQDVTDPRGIVAKSDYDLLVRTTSTTEAYVDGTPSAADDRITRYTYDGAGHVLTLTADLPSGQHDQVTQYVYGVTVGGGSDVASNDLLKEVRYPDRGTGAAGTASTDKQQYRYNALGETTQMTDQNGSVHQYGYDVLGRPTTDAVTTLGTGVDGAVRRLETAYDTQGNAYLFTSYDAASGGTVVNQVQRAFNGLGQLTTEWQAVSGTVNTTTTPKVQYAYTYMAGNVNNSRLTSVTYPNASGDTGVRQVSYTYDAGLDAGISRPSAIADASGTLEAYSYLGLSTVVERKHPEPGLDLTLVSPTGTAGPAGDQYVGLDAFGRVADQRWVDRGDPATAADDIDADRQVYAYDADSNRLTRDQSAASALPGATGLDEKYAYDGLNRLTKVERGTLSGGTLSGVTYSQKWDGTDGSGLDALGNWTGVATDADGAGAGAAATVTHGVNSQNQITSVSGSISPTYDAAGNMTRDETGQHYAYDAWNRTVSVSDASMTPVAKVTYTLDALGRRVREDVGAAGTGVDTDLYYSSGWQVLEERQGGVRAAQNVWSLAYVDGLVERDTFDATAADGALDAGFSGDGKLVQSIGAGVDAIRYVQQADGKIVGAGVASGHIGMVRLTRDGALDPTFDGPSGTANGAFAITIGTSDTLQGLAVQPDGQVVISGSSGGDVLVARLNGSNGAYDTSFSTDGWLKENLGGTDRGLKVAVDRDGKVVVAGDTTAGATGGDVAVERYNADGSLDTSFDTDGKLTTSLSAGADAARGLVVDDRNRILVAAYGDGNLDAVRYTQAGGLDTSFDADGKVSVDVNGTDQAESVAVDPRGRILLGGSSNGQKDFAVVRLTAAGALDAAFDGDGKATVSFSANSAASEIGYTMLLQPDDGRVVLAGLSDLDVAVARLGNGGTRYYAVQDANWNVTALADATGAVVDRFRYDAYGTQTVPNPDFGLDADGRADAGGQPYGFQGLRLDAGSLNWHARNRDLRSTLGTWTIADPKIYIGGSNNYSFVRVNPLNAVDPSGFSAWDWGGDWHSFIGRSWYEAKGLFSPSLQHYDGPIDQEATMDDIMFEYFNKVGPTVRSFNDEAYMTEAIRTNSGVNDAREKGIQGVKAGTTPGPIQVSHSSFFPSTCPESDGWRRHLGTAAVTWVQSEVTAVL